MEELEVDGLSFAELISGDSDKTFREALERFEQQEDE